jgi:hypothetical protein
MSGGPNSIRSPPRTPRRLPHPKPGTFSIWGMINNQGDKASQKLIIPILVDFIIFDVVQLNFKRFRIRVGQ